MDYSLYVAKTFAVALTKIGPVAGFIIFGYLIFIKLPFLVFRNSLRSSRSYEVAPARMQEEYKENYNVKDYNNFLRRQSRLESSGLQKTEEKKSEKKEEPRQEKKESKEGPKQQAHGERRQKERPHSPPREEKTGISPEESIFQFSAGQRFTKNELKKRYRDLLKQSHPDKVAALGEDFKKLAEMKTKEINSAYEKLKPKAA